MQISKWRVMEMLGVRSLKLVLKIGNSSAAFCYELLLLPRAPCQISEVSEAGIGECVICGRNSLHCQSEDFHACLNKIILMPIATSNS